MKLILKNLSIAQTKAFSVDFYADWCGPYKTLGPILDQLSKDYQNAMIIKVNVDDNQNLAAKFAIRSIPTLIILKNGKQVETLIGGPYRLSIRAKAKGI